jgi:Ca2+-binding RTX toxin-like protein
VLVVEGSRRADTIVLTRGSRGNVTVRVNDAVASFSKKSFSKIRILSGRGDDLIVVGSDSAPIVLPASIDAGEGNDTAIGGAGADTIKGSLGDDLLAGAGGNDGIDGEDGNDDLHGGDGKDIIHGRGGDDRLHDDSGIDAVYGDDGVDVFYKYDDAGQLKDKTRHEAMPAEPIYVQNPLSAGDLAAVKASPDALFLDVGTWTTAGGGTLDGGVLKVGGSSLVISGKGEQGFTGEGLGTTTAGDGLLEFTGAGTTWQMGNLALFASAVPPDEA